MMNGMNERSKLKGGTTGNESVSEMEVKIEAWAASNGKNKNTSCPAPLKGGGEFWLRVRWSG